MGLAVPYALISSFSTKFELEHALRLSKTTRLFVHVKLLPLALQVAKLVGLSPKNIYTIAGPAKRHRSLSEMILAVQKDKIPAVEVRPVSKDTLAYLIFSSGTSGLPKGGYSSPSLYYSSLITGSCPHNPGQLNFFIIPGSHDGRSYLASL